MTETEEKLLSKLEESQAVVRLMLLSIGEHARARGEAEGRLRISEMAGIVDGWRDRALGAETQLALVKSSWAAPLGALTNVTSDPELRGGAPCLRGTRITVAQILAELAETSGPGQVGGRLALSEESIVDLLQDVAGLIGALGRTRGRPDGTSEPVAPPAEAAEVLAAAVREARTWHEAADKAISKQPNAESRSYDRLQHQEQIALLDMALSQLGLPREDESGG